MIVLLLLMLTYCANIGGPGSPAAGGRNAVMLGILRWKEINGIHWDVVALYAAASAMGYGLATTGATLWLASGFLSLLPEVLKNGTGLCLSTSFVTGIMTNFMSDGATVAAVGPITVPMATLSGTSPVAVGLATAFASSFAHILIIGTPNNAIVFSLARDPETGEQLLTMKDFFIHGMAVFGLSLAVLWIWVFFWILAMAADLKASAGKLLRSN